jgi:hypothetical protein
MGATPQIMAAVLAKGSFADRHALLYAVALEGMERQRQAMHVVGETEIPLDLPAVVAEAIRRCMRDD